LNKKAKDYQFLKWACTCVRLQPVILATKEVKTGKMHFEDSPCKKFADPLINKKT
jgi:hypothetical protein